MLHPETISSAELTLRILQGKIPGFRYQGKLAYIVASPCFATISTLAYSAQIEWNNWAIASDYFGTATEAINWARAEVEV